MQMTQPKLNFYVGRRSTLTAASRTWPFGAVQWRGSTLPLGSCREARGPPREAATASATSIVVSRSSASKRARSGRRFRSSICHVVAGMASRVRVDSGGSAGRRGRMPAMTQRVCRRVAGNIPGRRLASRAGRIHVGGRLPGSRTCAAGGGLVDRRDSTDVIASSGTSAPVRNPQRASPGFTVEEQASHGRHPLAVSKAFRALPPTSQPSARSARNCQGYFWLPVARAHRELSGDVLAASGGQR